MDHLKQGVKQDNWSALRNAPLHLQSLFPDDVLCKTEDDIQKFEVLRLAFQPASGSRGLGPVRITGVNRTNRALPNNRKLQLGVFWGTEAQVVLPEAEARVPHVVQSPPVVQGLSNNDYHLSMTHVDSYMKPAPVPHVDNCQNVQCVNFVEPVQEVGVNLSFVVTPVHTMFFNGQQKNGPSPVYV